MELFGYPMIECDDLPVGDVADIVLVPIGSPARIVVYDDSGFVLMKGAIDADRVVTWVTNE